MAYTATQLKESIEKLYGDIDACITDLIRARLNKDAEGEGKALFKMEGLMVATEQELTCIGDYLEGKFEGVAQSYETGFVQGKEVGEIEMADKACEQFEKELRQMKNILNQVRVGAGKLISVGGSLIQFRKALNYRPSAPIFYANPEKCEK